MATLVIPGSAMVAIQMTASGQDVVNVIGIKAPSGSFIGTATDIANAVKTAFEAANGPLTKHTTTTHMVGYYCTMLDTATAPTAFVPSGASGTVFNDIATMASAAIIKISDGTRSRRAHGRLFHGPISENYINSDGRTLDSGNQAGLTSAYQQFQSQLATAGYDWAVLSRKYSESHAITNVGAASVIGTQRRRVR